MAPNDCVWFSSSCIDKLTMHAIERASSARSNFQRHLQTSSFIMYESRRHKWQVNGAVANARSQHLRVALKAAASQYDNATEHAI
jgi:hypothetical protein